MEKSIENKRKQLVEKAWVKASLGGTTRNHKCTPKVELLLNLLCKKGVYVLYLKL